MKYYRQLTHIVVIALLSYLLISPTSASGESQQSTDVIVGYSNEQGKEEIINNSIEVIHEFKHINAVTVTMPKSVLANLSGNKNITYIEENISVKLSEEDVVSEKDLGREIDSELYWNIEAIGSTFAWEEGYTGEGVKVAVIDTGISPHEDLTIAGGFSTVDYTTEWLDDNGHGTHIAGIIGSLKNNTGVVGVAPNVSLYAVKGLDDQGEGNMTDLIEAIDWSIQNEMDIINFSFGTKNESDAYRAITEEAYNNNILMVGSGGNDGSDVPVTFPAAYQDVIAVSAVNEELQITEFSSAGVEIEFAAPGVNVLSTSLNNSYVYRDGTSQSAPHVTGMLALLKQKFPDMTNRELREELKNYVEDLGEPGRDVSFGHGVLNYKMSDRQPPAEVTGISISDVTTESFTADWTQPSDSDFKKTKVYLDDELLTFTQEENKYTFDGLIPNTEYSLSFKTVDNFGNESSGTTKVVHTLEVEKKEEADKEKEEEKTDKANDEPTENESEEINKSIDDVKPKKDTNDSTEKESSNNTENVNNSTSKMNATEQAVTVRESSQSGVSVEGIDEEELDEGSTEADASEDVVEVRVDDNSNEDEQVDEENEKQEKSDSFFSMIVDAIKRLFKLIGSLFRNLFFI
ncbi:S8 family serine peptidase [Aquibacillus saliphilus]|uniref:S8 family serine peptidase n=1 Tax=Aquibacillus saliphilus TaxID=1909422 RepID=UPI001CF006B9|nr:S8 family serine peptidase [Aquibacillus saliphilus]